MEGNFENSSEFSTGELTATGQIGTRGLGFAIFIHRIYVRLASDTPHITLRNGGAAGELWLNAWVVAAKDVIEVNHLFANGCHYAENGAITLTFWYR